MTNRRKVAPGIFIPVFLIFMGIVALSNAASKPSFDAMRAVDVVRLVGVGMCFGAAIVTLVMFFRGPRSS
jgi:di/tricarboxylate transporter